MNYDRARRDKLAKQGETSVTRLKRTPVRLSIRSCPHCTLNADSFGSRRAFADHVEVCEP